MPRRHSSRLARGRIDWREPLTNHELNAGRVAWWLAEPRSYGGPKWFDLVSGIPATLTGFTSGSGWSPQSYPGGAGSLLCNGTTSYATATIANGPSGNADVAFGFWIYPLGTGASNKKCASIVDASGNTSTVVSTGAMQGSAGAALVSNTTVFTINAWNHFFYTFDGTTNRLYLNGQPNGTSTTAPSCGVVTKVVLGGRGAGDQLYNCYIAGFTLYKYPVAVGLVNLDRQLSQQGYPGVLRRRRRVAYSVPSSGTAYTLNAGSGTFTLIGTAATLTVARKLSASSGTFNLTGDTAPLSVGRKLSANPGSFTLNGTAANLSIGRRLSANAGTFTLNGSSATLLLNRVLNAAPATFTLTGASANLIAPKKLSANAGTFALAGQVANLSVSRMLQATPGSFSLSGSSATFKTTRVVLATPGNFVLTGFAATLIGPSGPTTTGIPFPISSSAAATFPIASTGFQTFSISTDAVESFALSP